MKECRSCHQSKPLDEFHKASNTPDGRQYVCKPCAIAAAILRAKQNPEAKREADKRYRQTDKYKAKRKARREGPKRDLILEQKRASHARHAEEIKEKIKAKRVEKPEVFKKYRDDQYASNKEAILERSRVWRETHRVELRAYQRLRTYGLSLEGFETLLAAQGGLCAICRVDMESLADSPFGKPRTGVCVDHNHDTGKVRGLLCSACNKAIGLMKDNAVRLRAAADYLDRTN